ncbi:MAG: GTPase HflX [Alphaproteobacteria bacterium]|nr:MAG: GTPase HflX [Alphaproteobacteria bacterium]
MPAGIDRTLASPAGAVIGVEFPRGYGLDDDPLGVVRRGIRTLEERVAEAVNLAQALNINIVHSEGVNLSRINPATLLGGGVVERIATLVAEQKIEVVFIDAALSPRQQRELEVQLKTKVVDRTGVILDIFAARARTRAGQLQVEVAQLIYQQSRLVRLWSHLERQRGGTGKAGGPGERQLDIDKSLLRTRLARVRGELREVEQTRGLQRMARQKADVPTVALVGYTNAGKSTLFNKMVDAGTLMADALFATLDPLMRRMELPGGLDVVLVDTVGFIADLPHELVEAFKATLEEVVMADLLLHVHDVSSAEMDAQAVDVRSVLSQIGAADKRVIHVYNKIDKAPEVVVSREGVGVSATTGQGVDELLEAIRNRLQADWETVKVQVDAGDGRRLAWLHAHGDVTEQHLVGETWTLVVKLRASDLAAWRAMA